MGDLIASKTYYFVYSITTAFIQIFLFIHFILKETIFITTFIGLILIVSGILFQQLDKTNRRSV